MEGLGAHFLTKSLGGINFTSQNLSMNPTVCDYIRWYTSEQDKMVNKFE